MPERFASAISEFGGTFGDRMKARVLIVDGHSMIFQWPDLSMRHARNSAAAREALVRMLQGLQDATDWTVAVVFDGKGSHNSEASEPDGIKVFYSKSGQTADSVIERLAAKYSSECDVTVATDDHMERTTVSAFGASTMSSVQLWDEIGEAGRELDAKIRALRKR